MSKLRKQIKVYLFIDPQTKDGRLMDEVVNKRTMTEEIIKKFIWSGWTNTLKNYPLRIEIDGVYGTWFCGDCITLTWEFFSQKDNDRPIYSSRWG